jgi:hypothetical protein
MILAPLNWKVREVAAGEMASSDGQAAPWDHGREDVKLATTGFGIKGDNIAS